jgi:hypothetical protein
MSLIISHSSPSLPAPTDNAAAAQAQSRVLVPVAPISVTAPARQDRSGSRQENESPRNGGPRQRSGSNSELRGRLVDIVV